MWTYIATKFKDFTNVIFEIFNEPREWSGSQSASDWYDICIQSINAIRETGVTNKICIPGVDFTGVHNWMDDNASTFQGIDSDGNINNLGDFTFSMHQYFDTGYTGKDFGVNANQRDFDIDNWFNVDNLGGTTYWLKANNYTAILTETNIMQNSNDLVDENNYYYVE
jgi:hypothetical protein